MKRFTNGPDELPEAPKRSRVCFTLRVRRDMLDEYRLRHAAVWPGMLRALQSSGWSNYSLFLDDDGLLVGYLETDDFAAAREAMAQAEVNARWQAEMAPFFESTDGRPDENMQIMPLVFQLETQLAVLDGRDHHRIER
ncbi:MAG: L-rhamnose mutarotase [Microcella sp.]